MASGNPTSGVVDVARHIQTGLSNLWHHDVCTDFEVTVGGQTFHCHKVVLAAVSDYFQAMFTSGMREAVQNKSTLEDIQPAVFESTLDIIYDVSGEKVRALFEKGTDEIQEYLRIAGMLQMKFLKDICLKYFKDNLQVHNCIEVWKIARSLQMQDLQDYAWIYILSNFKCISFDQMLLTLDFDDFKTIVEETNLKVKDEMNVCNAILSWVQFDSTRENKLTPLLKCCSLSQVDVKYLVEELSFHPLCRKFDDALEIIKQAIAYKFHEDQHGNLSLSLRSCTGFEQIPILLGERKTMRIKCFLGYSRRQRKWISIMGPRQGIGKYFACCIFGKFLHITGGSPHASLHLRYSGESGMWEEKEKMIVPLQKHTMTAHGDSLFIFGGCALGNINGQILAFNLDDESWDIVGELIAPVHSASSACLADKIYIVGGVLNESMPGDAEVADSVQVFDARTKTCTIFCHLPNPCGFSRAVSDNNNVFIVTGSGEVVKLKSSSAEPEVIARIPDFNRCNFGAVLKDHVLSIYGGVLVGDDVGVRQSVSSVDVISRTVTASTSLPAPYEIYGSVLLVMNTKCFVTEQLHYAF